MNEEDWENEGGAVIVLEPKPKSGDGGAEAEPDEDD